MKFKAFILSLILLLTVSTQAANIYVAQSATGSGSGADSSNCKAIATINSSWTLAAGDTIHLTNTFTTGLIIGGSGSTGNPITIYFESGAKFSKPGWSGNIIDVGNHNNITIDGGVNGIIESTANGTGLANTNNATGVSANSANNLTVKNLKIQNLYVRTMGGEQNDYCNGIQNYPSVAPYGYTNMVVTNCVLHDMYIAVSCPYGTGGCTNIYIQNNIMTNINWGVQCGDVAENSICDYLYITGNTIGNFTMWDDPTLDSFHHNAAYGWANYGTSVFRHAIVSGNYVFGFGTYQTSGFYFSGQTGASIGMIGPIYVINNIFSDPVGNPANGCMYFLPNAGFFGLVANNNVLGNAWNKLLDWDAVYGGTQTVLHYNNIISNSLDLAVFDNATAVLKSDYNGLDTNTINGLGSWFSYSANNSAALYDFATWKGLGFDTHTLTAKLNLGQSTPPATNNVLVGAGTNLSSYFTTDYAGNTRPATGAWTIGAYESTTNNVNTATNAFVATGASGTGNYSAGDTVTVTANGQINSYFTNYTDIGHVLANTNNASTTATIYATNGTIYVVANYVMTNIPNNTSYKINNFRILNKFNLN
jgi:hypothetical protein